MGIFPYMKAHHFDTDLKFLKNGGFVYFDDDATAPRPLHICAIDGDAGSGSGQLHFSKPKKLSQEWSDYLSSEGRFLPITIDALREQGATHFCWIIDNEDHNGEQICPKGGFAYRFSHE